MTALEFYEREKNNIKVEKHEDGAIMFKRLMIKFAEMYHAQAITVTQCCMGEAEQLFCSCGSRKVKTTGGSQCTNNRCNL